MILKKQLVEEDEFDSGVRRLLNYGHTFGHALEAITDYAIPHGVAVAQGINLVNFIACQLGFLSETIYADVSEFVARYFSYDFSVFNLTAEQLIHKAKKDKKASQGKNYLILMENMGKFRIEPLALDQVSHLLHSFLN